MPVPSPVPNMVKREGTLLRRRAKQHIRTKQIAMIIQIRGDKLRSDEDIVRVTEADF